MSSRAAAAPASPSSHSVRSALSGLRSLEERSRHYDSQRELLDSLSRALATEIYAGVPAFFARRMKKEARESSSKRAKNKTDASAALGLEPLASPDFSSLQLCAARIKIEGDTLSGWLSASDIASPARGWRIQFSTSSLHPAAVEWASAQSAEHPMPASQADSYVVELQQPPMLKVHWSALLDAIESCRTHESSVRQFWSEQPADFHLYWAGLILEDLEGLAADLPPRSLSRISAELAAALRKREIVIERNTGDPSDGYTLCLPSFEIIFSLAGAGRAQIRRIEGREQFLFWNRAKTLYSASKD